MEVSDPQFLLEKKKNVINLYSACFNLGNLYFPNIRMEDSLDGANYVCIVSNHVLRGLVQGDDQRIIPEQSSGNTHQNHWLQY